MPPFYKFMTGANQYRIEAKNREEAIEIALSELQPDANTTAVILNTLYDESEGKQFEKSDSDSDE